MIIKENGWHVWEEKDLEFLKKNYESLTNRQLAKQLGIKLTTCRKKLYELGLKRMEMEYWNEEMVVFLRENYRSIGDVELSEIFEEKYPKNKPWTEKHIRKKRVYLDLHRTKSEVAAVKKRNIDTGRFAECAVKRWKTTTQAPVGEIRTWNHQDGGEFAVIKTESGFVHYNRWLYEKHHGPQPSHKLVVTISGDTTARGIEDLELISRSEHSRRNTLKRYPVELRETVRLLRQLNKYVTQNN